MSDLEKLIETFQYLNLNFEEREENLVFLDRYNYTIRLYETNDDYYIDFHFLNGKILETIIDENLY
jgi:hypothetical protein